MPTENTLPPFATTVIQVEARATTGYRAVFDEIDEHTGRPIVSSWYDSHDEVVRKWAPHGFVDIEEKDGRVIELEALLHECRKAYREHGSLGVTFALNEHQFRQAQTAANIAAAELDAYEDERSSRPIKYTYDRALQCRTFNYNDYLVRGVRISVLFEHEFQPGAADSSTKEADAMNKLLRVSFDHDNGLMLHRSEGCPEVSIVDYMLEVETAPVVMRYFSIEQAEFETLLRTHRQHFQQDEALSCDAYSTTLA